jgi:hypothetical protein
MRSEFREDRHEQSSCTYSVWQNSGARMTPHRQHRMWLRKGRAGSEALALALPQTDTAGGIQAGRQFRCCLIEPVLY